MVVVHAPRPACTTRLNKLYARSNVGIRPFPRPRRRGVTTSRGRAFVPRRLVEAKTAIPGPAVDAARETRPPQEVGTPSVRQTRAVADTLARPAAPTFLGQGLVAVAPGVLAVDAAAVATEITGLPVGRLLLTAALLVPAPFPARVDMVAQGDAAQTVFAARRGVVSPARVPPIAAVVDVPPPVGLVTARPCPGGVVPVIGHRPARRLEVVARRVLETTPRPPVALDGALVGRDTPRPTAGDTPVPQAGEASPAARPGHAAVAMNTVTRRRETVVRPHAP